MDVTRLLLSFFSFFFFYFVYYYNTTGGLMGKKSCITRYFRVKSRDCLNLIGYIECHIFRIRLDILFLSTFFKTLLHTKSSHCLGNIVCKNSFFLSFLSNIILQQTINNNVCSACVLPTYIPSILTNFLPSRAFVAFIFLKRSRGLPDPK